jgi:hypothetical protein
MPDNEPMRHFDKTHQGKCPVLPVYLQIGLWVAALLLATLSPSVAAPDVTANAISLGVAYPNSKGPYSRNVWDMQIFNGRIYLGHGNSSNNAPESNSGPIPILYLDLATSQFVNGNNFSVDDEQIDVYRIINGKLCTPGHDPQEGWELGNFYRWEPGGWVKNRTIPEAIHAYDLYGFDGKLFAALGIQSANSSTVVSSNDNGLTWQIYPETDLGRRYTLFELNGILYAPQGVLYTDPTWAANYPDCQMAQYNGSGFTMRTDLSFQDLFPDTPCGADQYPDGRFGKIVRPVNFANRLVYIGGEEWNDHQTYPFGLYVASSLAAGNVQVYRVSLPGNALPWDVLVRGDKIYVLTSEKTEGTPDSFLVKVFSSEDLVTWTELFRFTEPTFARSFEEDNGDFYFGLGTDVGATNDAASYTDNVQPESGKILRVAKAAYTGLMTNIPPVANSQSVTDSLAEAKTITLAASDAESSPLTYEIVTPPTHGVLSGTAPNLTYTPTAIGADSFTFKVHDGMTYSNTATVSITVAAGSLPTQALNLWVRSDIGVVRTANEVTAWNDLSGNGNNLERSGLSRQPGFASNAVNGFPVIRFDGSNDYLRRTLTTPYTGESTTFIVAAVTPGQTAPRGLFSTGTLKDDTATYELTVDGTSPGALRMHTVANYAAGSVPSQTAFQLLTLVIKTNTLEVYRGGQLFASYALGSTEAKTYLNYTLGAERRTFASLGCDIAETLVYQRVLSAEDRQKVEGYLANRYGLPYAGPPIISPTDDLQITPPGAANINPVTGRYEHSISVSNAGTGTAGGFLLRVADLPVGVSVVGGVYDATSNSWIVGCSSLVSAGGNAGLVLSYAATGNPGSFTPAVTLLPPTIPPPPAGPDFSMAIRSPDLDPGSGRATLSFNAEPGRSYLIEYSHDLKTWLPATGVITARNGAVEWTDDGSITGSLPFAAGKRFYRAKDLTP